MSSRTPTHVPTPMVEHRNEVELVGRFSGRDDVRQLPSGDTVLGFRIVVDRPDRARAHGRAPVDTIDCQAVAPRARQTVARLQAGDVIDVRGALRRRFYRRPGGTASRYGVEVSAVRRVRSG